MNFNILFEPNLSKEDEEIIYKGLIDFNVIDLNLTFNEIKSKNFSFIIKENDNIITGLVGYIEYTSLFVDILWVHEKIRKNGAGSALLMRAEMYAKENNCQTIFLNTLSKSNARFYEKRGFVFELLRENYIGKYPMRYFRKDL